MKALHDINEEMQENAREIELELREELDMSSAKVRELQRDKETMQVCVKNPFKISGIFLKVPS